jgi:hypothetical protein
VFEPISPTNTNRSASICPACYWGAAIPFARRLGVALYRGEARTEGASDFDGRHPSFFGFDYPLARVFGVGVHARMKHPAQR